MPPFYGVTGGGAGSGLIGSAGVSGPFGSGWGTGDGAGAGCSGALGAGTSALIVTFGSLGYGYELQVPD
jgi:hypothetical protein